jgi:hypothetical protein
MKPKLNPDFPTTPILIMLLCSALILLAIGVPGIFYIRDWLATGRVYSMAALFGDGEMISRSSAPEAYWTMMGFLICSCAGSLGLGILAPIFNIRAYMKKLARQKKERGNQ